MIDYSNMCSICDCLYFVLVIIGASLVWGQLGSLAIGAEVPEGQDDSIYMVESGEFIKTYIIFNIIYTVVVCVLMCCVCCAGCIGLLMMSDETT